MQNSLSQNVKFFNWLLDTDNIEMESTIDLTLAPIQDDPNIYYPKQIGELLKTRPMQRISKISQLATYISSEPNAYHSRLEHCLGTYNQKKNIIMNLCKDSRF